MENRRIPTFNDTLDLNTLIYILKKNVILSVVIIAICFVAAFLYLRYTPRVYEATSVIQINQDANQPFDVQSYERLYGQTSLDNLIELIRSKEFLKSVVAKLPLEISYFSKGMFLNFELYKSSPFFVEIDKTKTLLLDIPYNVVFVNDKEFILEYEIDGSARKYTLPVNTWNEVDGMRFYLNISNYQRIVGRDDETLQENKFYFVVNSSEGAFQTQMQDGLNVAVLSPEANTIQISYQSDNALKAADIADSVAQSFLTYNVLVKQKQANKVIDYVDRQLNIIKRSLDSAERALKFFKRQNNIKDLLDRQGSGAFPQVSFGQSIEDGTQKIDKEYGALTKMQMQISSGVQMNTAELLSLVSDAQSESMIIKFLNAIEQLQRDKDVMLINVTENNNKIKILDKQIEEQKRLLSEFIKITTDRLMKDRLEMSKNKKKKDTVQTQEYDELKLSQLLRTYSVQQEYYNQLLEQKSKYSILRASVVTENIILEMATEPKEHISPRKSIVLIVAIILALLLSLSIVIVKYLLHDEITGPEDISKYTTVPIVGIIPNTKRNKNKQNRLLVENRPDSIFTESFRTLRSNLDFLTNQSGSKVVTVSSTVSGEGKTFVAINLGGVMAFMGKRVIMIDLDLRKPKVHVALDVENVKGMSTLIIGRHGLQECIQHSIVDKFDFITAGPIPPNPSELVVKPELDVIIEQLKLEYDVIIIDTPPIGIVADAIYSYQRSDFPIYITRMNYSKRNFIYNLNYLRDERNIKNISVVLNGVDSLNSRYGYGYAAKGGTIGYGYGYGYSYGWSEGYYAESKKKKGFWTKLLSRIKKTSKKQNP